MAWPKTIDVLRYHRNNIFSPADYIEVKDEIDGKNAYSEGQPRLADRAQHVAWLAGAGRPDFPAVAVLRVAEGATMRQACTAAGIDPDAPLVGIPAAPSKFFRRATRKPPDPRCRKVLGVFLCFLAIKTIEHLDDKCCERSAPFRCTFHFFDWNSVNG